MGDTIVWADIPVTDMDRAVKFYSHVTQQEVALMPGSNDGVAVIGSTPTGEEPIVSADLYLGGKPSHDGSTVYLRGGGDIDGVLARVAEAGGTILEAKKFMGDVVGWIAFFEDSEGNRIGVQQSA